MIRGIRDGLKAVISRFKDHVVIESTPLHGENTHPNANIQTRGFYMKRAPCMVILFFVRSSFLSYFLVHTFESASLSHFNFSNSSIDTLSSAAAAKWIACSPSLCDE